MNKQYLNDLHEGIMQVHDRWTDKLKALEQRAELVKDCRLILRGMHCELDRLQGLINALGEYLYRSGQSAQEAIDTPKTESAPIAKLVEDLDDTHQ